MDSHLSSLEAEAIYIFREAAAGFERPVLLYSIGKDSSVLLRLAQKAFFPNQIPFPLLHIDTTWKFRDMIAFRDRIMKDLPAVRSIIHVNREGLFQGVNPITSGSSVHTRVMKTEALRQAIDSHKFDAAIGGARRDEERSRAKERIFSLRLSGHRWDPRRQRPEFWNLYNLRLSPSESMRVFPLSNWTEVDIWRYILDQRIEIVPLYLAALRPVVQRGDGLVMVDDDRLPLLPGEVPQLKSIRFRSLGCYPLSAAVESDADTIEKVVAETMAARSSERQGRMIDLDESASMERKKREGYF